MRTSSGKIIARILHVFGHILIRGLARHFGDQSWWQRALDDISGTTLAETRSDLGRWVQLQRE